MTALLIPLLFLAFAGVCVLAVRNARIRQQEFQERIARAGFTQETRPQQIAQLKHMFGALEQKAFAQSHAGYTLWFLSRLDTDGPGQPFLGVVFDQPPTTNWQAISPTHEALQGVWIMPAVSQGGDLALKAIGFVAKLAGYANRLPLPEALSTRWWAYAQHHAWQPAPPNEAFWAALGRAGGISVRGVPAGLVIELQSGAIVSHTPTRDALIGPKLLACAQSVAEAVLQR